MIRLLLGVYNSTVYHPVICTTEEGAFIRPHIAVYMYVTVQLLYTAVVQDALQVLETVFFFFVCTYV